MLQSLHIENIAVIKSVDIDLSEGLCVLTGETGAGKSLLIDSVSFLTGGRVSRDLIRAGEDRALVSALFSPPEGELAEALSELGIDLPEGACPDAGWAFHRPHQRPCRDPEHPP